MRKKKVNPRGVFIPGWQAVGDFSKGESLALESQPEMAAQEKAELLFKNASLQRAVLPVWETLSSSDSKLKITAPIRETEPVSKPLSGIYPKPESQMKAVSSCLLLNPFLSHECPPECFDVEHENVTTFILYLEFIQIESFHSKSFSIQLPILGERAKYSTIKVKSIRSVKHGKELFISGKGNFDPQQSRKRDLKIM
jgi:hypothetical protein